MRRRRETAPQPATANAAPRTQPPARANTEIPRSASDRLGHDPYGGPNLLGPDDIALLGTAVAASEEVREAVDALWPALTPEELVAGFLADTGCEAIRRVDGEWTTADVPLLDVAAELLGADDSAARAAAEGERQREIAFAQGVLDLSYEFRRYDSRTWTRRTRRCWPPTTSSTPRGWWSRRRRPTTERP